MSTPTVKEFIGSYRYVYETTVKGQGSSAVEAAYQKLFDVENRTDDLIEAQLIIEKEGLLMDTVIADYKSRYDEFMSKADPNYKITTAVMDATIGRYAAASSAEELTYMSEIAKAVSEDIAVQVRLQAEMIQNLSALIFGWAHSKRKIREGDVHMDEYAKAMVITRNQTKKYYRFLEEDMGITFDDIEDDPFYRILFLQPEGMDELWKIKKVMHPDNIKAGRCLLFEEILSEKTLEEILMTIQPYPYYEK